MCVIGYMPANVRADDAAIRRAWCANPDGAGLMFPGPKGRLTIDKGFMRLKGFLKAYHAVPENVPLIVHFRIATSGLVNEHMCHPFWVSGELGVAHNGILDVPVPKGSKESDTAIFVRDTLSKLPAGFMENDAITNLILHRIGNRNKLAFMDATGAVLWLGDRVKTKDGQWWSNRSFEESMSFWGYASDVPACTLDDWDEWEKENFTEEPEASEEQEEWAAWGHDDLEYSQDPREWGHLR